MYAQTVLEKLNVSGDLRATVYGRLGLAFENKDCINQTSHESPAFLGGGRFNESANQEAVHAGFYATLNGRCPKDFWQFVAGVAKAEYKGESSVKALADKVRAAGFSKAADEMEIFAKQEGHHGVVIDELLKKYAPKISEAPAQKTFVCSVCGYEHVGDAPPENCPVCGQPASVFKEKAAPKTFVCSVCGYEHVGDAPPENCPVCGQPKSMFTQK